MFKKCKSCGARFEGRANKLYCSPKCRKDAEVELRKTPAASGKARRPAKGKAPTTGTPALVLGIRRPDTLNEIAAGFWDKTAPLLIKRGHLNILSEDAFAELCDLYSRLRDINSAIDETNRSLMQIEDKFITTLDRTQTIETQAFKESALSDLKRKYSKQFLDFCKQFYLTPLSNRGNFGLEDDEEEIKKDGKERFF